MCTKLDIHVFIITNLKKQCIIIFNVFLFDQHPWYITVNISYCNPTVWQVRTEREFHLYLENQREYKMRNYYDFSFIGSDSETHQMLRTFTTSVVLKTGVKMLDLLWCIKT